MNKPKYCKTPARDSESYVLTATDIKNMTNLAGQIRDMLYYYSNMPENKTGEIYHRLRNMEKFDELCMIVEDIDTVLMEMCWVH